MSSIITSFCNSNLIIIMQLYSWVIELRYPENLCLNYFQKNYGYDVIYRFMQKAASANIPTNQGITDKGLKQFSDCIKAETSKDVDEEFVKE